MLKLEDVLLVFIHVLNANSLNLTAQPVPVDKPLVEIDVLSQTHVLQEPSEVPTDNVNNVPPNVDSVSVLLSAPLVPMDIFSTDSTVFSDFLT